MARRTWVYVNGVGIPKEEYEQHREVSAPMVMPDIKPYTSMIDGQTINSRSIHRDHLRQHGCIEIGNEKLTAKPMTPLPGLRDQLARAVYTRL